METDGPSASTTARNRTGSFALWLLGIVLMHPLSLGPVGFAQEKGWLGWRAEDAVSEFYAPEIWLLEESSDEFDWLASPYGSYLEMWARWAGGTP